MAALSYSLGTSQPEMAFLAGPDAFLSSQRNIGGGGVDQGRYEAQELREFCQPAWHGVLSNNLCLMPLVGPRRVFDQNKQILLEAGSVLGLISLHCACRLLLAAN
jgi:hypothetical protein